MGVYINPPGRQKEEFVWEHGTEITENEVKAFSFHSEEAEHTSVVCLVQNPLFSAAAVMYNTREQEEFTQPDPRPRKFYKISKDVLLSLGSGIPENQHARVQGS